MASQTQNQTANPVMSATATPLLGLQPSVDAPAILCVCEDERVTRRELVAPLTNAGFQVDVLKNESELDIAAISGRYRAILLDIASPEGSGYELCQQLRLQCSLPVMLILRSLARGQVLRGYKAGADTHMLAPLDSRELIARLNALLRRQRLSAV